MEKRKENSIDRRREYWTKRFEWMMETVIHLRFFAKHSEWHIR